MQRLLLAVWLVLLHCERNYTQGGSTKRAPLYMFTSKEDIEQTLPSFAEIVDFSRVIYVSNGEVTLGTAISPTNAMGTPVPGFVPITSWTLLACEEDITVNITWTSMNTSLLGNPLLSIPPSFTLPKCPYRVINVYPCSLSQAGVSVLTKMVINAYTAKTQFAPMEMYFYKYCSNVAPPELAGITEFSSDFANVRSLLLNATRGCYNDTDPPTKPPEPIVEKSSASPGVIAASVVIPTVIFIIIVVLVAVALVWFYQHHNKQIVEFTLELLSERYQAGNPIFDRVAALKQAGPHAKEFSSEKVTFVRELGEGAFGRVYQGMASNIIAGEDSSIVAVKQLKTNTVEDDDAVVVEFFKEVTFMSKLDHRRIVKLLGVCTLTEPYCMIFEYMDFGDLNAYLRSAIGLGPDCDEAEDKGTCFLQLSDLLSILEQIAEGMEYLSNQSLVHRDLATRNCLVATGLVVKISDFGLSRDVNSTDYYRVHGRAVLPIRWMAPESIIYGKFTVATDVWSFGVVMWEVFTYGQQPYVGLTNEEVISFVTKQGTLKSPSGCPETVTKLMAQCWSQSPASRPKFSKVLTAIQHLTSTLKDVMYDSPDYPALALQVTLTDAN